MRKALIIAIGLASLGAIASVQPAFADCQQKCVAIAPPSNTKYHGVVVHAPRPCVQWALVCTTTGSQGPGAVNDQSIQDRKHTHAN